MRQQDFLNIDVLKRYIVNRKPKSESVSFIEARVFVFDDAYKEGYFIRMDYSDAPLNPVRLMPGKKAFSQKVFNLADVQLSQKYNAPIALNEAKIVSLKRLLAYIDTTKYPYIKDILSHQERLPQANLTPSQSNELDADDELLDYD
ncbi:hypothetical protein Pcinc_002508 [Petrolisthes cinctipes]|uniref:Uncharacterized protein n=1 Tax=Petrolisthes cinctipes TaxID=88211 RepID=A0AAE1L5C9_PETCI|nr:hypothetical protein Pcinc_002508 [Petrolisthes cinctipes]